MTDPSDLDKKPEPGNGSTPPEGTMTQPVLPGGPAEPAALAGSSQPRPDALPAAPEPSSLPAGPEPAAALPVVPRVEALTGTPQPDALPAAPEGSAEPPAPPDAATGSGPEPSAAGTANEPGAELGPEPEPAAGEEFPESTDGGCETPVVKPPAIDLSQVASVEAAEPGGVTPVVAVKFQRACKNYFFNAGKHELKIGDQVIVETERGLGLARVVTPVIELKSDKITAQLKRVIRKAHFHDLDRDRKNREREHEALKLCQERIVTFKLPMKLVKVEYLHDASKAVFFFSAESRVDFRDLVKDLARLLHTRIEMRQIGVRDESKIIGGIGPCGREVCCSTFLTDFVPVSVRMAKDQNLAMNPGKVSGLCGRLMCCLSYEHTLYAEQVKKMPKKGKTLRCNDGPCRIIDLNILGAKVLVELESGKTMFIPASELRPLDQLEPNPGAEPREEEKEEPDDSALLDTDDPNALVEKSDRPKPPARDRNRPRPQPPREGGPPRPGQPRDDRRDGQRRDGQRDGRRDDRRDRPRHGDRRDQRHGQPSGQPSGPPAGEPRGDRPLPPPSTTAYTGRQRPPGAQPSRPDRDRPRPDRPDGRRDERREQPGREAQPGNAPDGQPTPPPGDGQPGQPGQPGENRPHGHHHHRRRRKNH